MGMNKSQKFIFVLVMIILLIFIWGLFPLFFKWLMISIGVEKTKLEDFGTLGDIYGSLNTLFTSATLIIVIYSTYLQREANKDAGKALENQLRQAEQATTDQLNQSKDSTTQQLNLAQTTHDALIKEMMKSNFDNKFYFLLNYKMQLLNSIKVYNSQDGEIVGALIFDKINTFFTSKIFNKRYETVTELSQLRDEYLLYILKLNEQNPITSINSYILTYKSLYILLDQASYLDEDDKKIYFELIRNSCLTAEQVTIFFLTPFLKDVKEIFLGRELFHSFDVRNFSSYARDHFDESYFFWDIHKDLFNKS